MCATCAPLSCLCTTRSAAWRTISGAKPTWGTQKYGSAWRPSKNRWEGGEEEEEGAARTDTATAVALAEEEARARALDTRAAAAAGRLLRRSSAGRASPLGGEATEAGVGDSCAAPRTRRRSPLPPRRRRRRTTATTRAAGSATVRATVTVRATATARATRSAAAAAAGSGGGRGRGSGATAEEWCSNGGWEWGRGQEWDGKRRGKKARLCGRQRRRSARRRPARGAAKARAATPACEPATTISQHQTNKGKSVLGRGGLATLLGGRQGACPEPGAASHRRAAPRLAIEDLQLGERRGAEETRECAQQWGFETRRQCVQGDADSAMLQHPLSVHVSFGKSVGCVCPKFVCGKHFPVSPAQRAICCFIARRSAACGVTKLSPQPETWFRKNHPPWTRLVAVANLLFGAIDEGHQRAGRNRKSNCEVSQHTSARSGTMVLI